MEQLTFKILRSCIIGTFNFIVYEFQLADLNRGWDNPYQVYFEPYKNKDAHLLKEVIEKMDIDRQFTLNEVDQRNKDGHRFYVAKKNEKIIGYVWYLISKFKIQEFDATIYLKPNEVYSANAYIQPDFRGLGILNYMRAYVYDELKKNGYTRVLTFVVDWNKSAIRMHEKWGSAPIGIVRLCNILTLSFQYSNVTSIKLAFHGGPFLLWKKLYRRIRNYESKGA